MEEAVIEDPQTYPNVNALFTRTLKDGCADMAVRSWHTGGALRQPGQPVRANRGRPASCRRRGRRSRQTNYSAGPIRSFRAHDSSPSTWDRATAIACTCQPAVFCGRCATSQVASSRSTRTLHYLFPGSMPATNASPVCSMAPTAPRSQLSWWARSMSHPLRRAGAGSSRRAAGPSPAGGTANLSRPLSCTAATTRLLPSGLHRGGDQRQRETGMGPGRDGRGEDLHRPVPAGAADPGCQRAYRRCVTG